MASLGIGVLLPCSHRPCKDRLEEAKDALNRGMFGLQGGKESKCSKVVVTLLQMYDMIELDMTMM